MSTQFEVLASKVIGDDVAGPFTDNNSQSAPNTKNGRFEGEAEFSENFNSYVDQADADANWITSNTTFLRANPANDLLDFDNQPALARDYRIDFDLWSQGIFPSDTKWTVRAKVDITTLIGGTDPTPSNIIFGLGDSDNTVSQAANQDFIGIRFLAANLVERIQSQQGNNTSILFGANDVFFDETLTATTYFVEIKRTSATTYEVSLFSDSDYSVLIEKIKSTCGAGIIDLRYIKAGVFNGDATTDTTITGTIDDISFFDDSEGQQNFLVLHVPEKTPGFEDDLSGFATPITKTVDDDFSDATLWTTTDSTRVRVEDEQGFLFQMAIADGTNDAIARGLGTDLSTDFSDDFSTYVDQAAADAAWIPTDVTNARVNVSLDQLDVIQLNDSTNDTCLFDLASAIGAIDGAEWVLRYKLTINSQTFTSPGLFVEGFFGLTNSSGAASVAQNSLGLHIRLSNTGPNSEFRANSSLGVAIYPVQPGGQFTVIDPDPAVYFIEIRRISTLSSRINIFSDANFTNLLETQTFSLGFLGTFTHLGYKNDNLANFAGQTLFEIDDIQFWNGVSIPPQGPASDESWVLRWEQNVTDLNNGGNGQNKESTFGLFELDQTQGSGDVGDQIFMKFKHDIGNTRIIVGAGDGVTPMASNVGDIIPDPGLNDTETFFCEIKRLSATSVIWNIYNDSLFTDIRASFGPFTIPSTLEDLRFLKLINDETSNGAGNIDSTIRNVQFWNATPVTRDPALEASDFFDDFSTYADQGSADTAWPSADVTRNRVNITTDVIDFNFNIDANLAIVHDLGAGNVSDTEWTLRFKLNFSTITTSAQNGSYFGISSLDETNGADVVQDAIILKIRNGPTAPDQKFEMVSVDNVSPNGVFGVELSAEDPAIDTDYYVEIKRQSTTTFVATVFNDADYQSIRFTKSFTTVVGLASLRYIKFFSVDQAPSGVQTGTIDDVQFWNGKAAEINQNSWIPQGTDFDLNTERSLIDFDAADQNSLQMITQDLLAPVSNDTWSMRFKLVIEESTQGADATPLQWFVGLHALDETQTMNQVGAYMGLKIEISNSEFKFEEVDTNIVQNPVTTVGSVFLNVTPLPGTYFIEMKRIGGRLWVSIFDDELYEDLIETVLGTLGSPIVGLQYLKIANGDNGDGTEDSTLIGNITDFRVFDGDAAPDGYEQRDWLQQMTSMKFGQGGDGDLRVVLDNINAFNLGGLYQNRINTNNVEVNTGVATAEALPAGASPIASEDKFWNMEIIALDANGPSGGGTRRMVNKMIGAGPVGNFAPNKYDAMNILISNTDTIVKTAIQSLIASTFDTDSQATMFGAKVGT